MGCSGSIYNDYGRKTDPGVNPSQRQRRPGRLDGGHSATVEPVSKTACRPGVTHGNAVTDSFALKCLTFVALKGKPERYRPTLVQHHR